MKKLEKFFLDKTKDLSFIELKKGSNVEINGFKLNPELPLPVITEKLVEDIKLGKAENEINIANMIDGIIYLLGSDGAFKYNEDYIDILNNYNKDINDYISNMASKYIVEEDYIMAALYLRANIYLDNKNPLYLFKYTMTVENLLDEIEDEELKEDIILSITNVLESILDIDEEYPLAYYKLGYYYRFNQQFLKTKLIWEKYLQLEDDVERKNEIREEISLLNADIEYEESLLLLTQGQYHLALDKLLKLSEKTDWWNIFYLVGISYKNLNDTEEAVKYFELAIKKGGEDATLYNELAIAYFTLGDVQKALDNLNIGLEIDPNNFELYFNIGLVYEQLGLLENAIENIEKAYSINPDTQIQKHLERLKR